jgi:hypothetical protein
VYDGATRRTITLGPWASAKAQQEYERLLARLRTAQPSQLTTTTGSASAPADVSINEALLAYVKHVEGRYPPRSAQNHLDALRPVRRMAGVLPLAEFTPKVYKTVRQTLFDAGLARTTINARMQKVGQFVK